MVGLDEQLDAEEAQPPERAGHLAGDLLGSGERDG